MTFPLLALILAATPLAASPRIAAFACQIGEDGRTRIHATREREENADDELHCRASLRGLGGRSPADLVAELRVLPPTGPFRVVASQPLSPGSTADGARLSQLLVPNSTWISAV